MSELLQAANTLRAQRRYEQALDLIFRHLETEPDCAWGHALAADCHWWLGHKEDALESIGRALTSRPDYGFAHYIQSYIFAKDRQKSMAAAREAVRLDPKDSDYWARVSELHLHRDELKQARKAARRGLECDANHCNCALYFGYAELHLNRKKSATNVVKRLMTLYPDNHRVHTLRGWILLERNRAQEALDCFHEALRIEPEDAWAINGRNEALRHFPRPYPGIVPLLKDWFSWYGIGLTVAVAACYLGGIVFTADAVLPQLQIFWARFAVVVLGAVIFGWAIDALTIQGRNHGLIGPEHLAKKRRDEQLFLTAVMALAGLVWIVSLVFWSGAAAQVATLFSWTMIPTAAAFYSLPGWRKRLARYFAGGFFVTGFIALLPWVDISIGNDGWTVTSVLKGIQFACLLLSLQFRGRPHTNLFPQHTPIPPPEPEPIRDELFLDHKKPIS